MERVLTILLLSLFTAFAQPMTQGELGWPNNTPPSAFNIIANVAKNQTVTNHLYGTDRESGVTYSLGTGPTNGTATLLDALAGTVRYVPTTDYVGTDYYEFTVRDAGGLPALGRVYLIITNLDCASTWTCFDIPGNNGQTYVLRIEYYPPAGQCISLPPPFNTVTNTMPDGAGFPLDTPGQVCNPPYSALITTLIYQQSGSAQTVCITNACSPCATNALVASNLNLSLLVNTSVSTNLSGSTGCTNALTYSLTQNPTNGTVTGLNTNTGAFTYTPTTDYSGADNFFFRAYNGFKYATNQVGITITNTCFSQCILSSATVSGAGEAAANGTYGFNSYLGTSLYSTLTNNNGNGYKVDWDSFTSKYGIIRPGGLVAYNSGVYSYCYQGVVTGWTLSSGTNPVPTVSVFTNTVFVTSNTYPYGFKASCP